MVSAIMHPFRIVPEIHAEMETWIPMKPAGNPGFRIVNRRSFVCHASVSPIQLRTAEIKPLNFVMITMAARQMFVIQLTGSVSTRPFPIVPAIHAETETWIPMKPAGNPGFRIVNRRSFVCHASVSRVLAHRFNAERESIKIPQLVSVSPIQLRTAEIKPLIFVMIKMFARLIRVTR